MSADHQALNEEIIDELVAILGDGFAEIIDEQLDQANIYMADLKGSLGSGDVEQSMRTAHALKSSTGQVGMQGIHLLAKELEFKCRADMEENNGVTDEAKSIFQTICDEFEGAVTRLRAHTENS